MNVIIWLCHSLHGKVGTFQESLMLVMQAFVDIRLLLATALIVKAGWPLVWWLRSRVNSRRSVWSTIQPVWAAQLLLMLCRVNVLQAWTMEEPVICSTASLNSTPESRRWIRSFYSRYLFITNKNPAIHWQAIFSLHYFCNDFLFWLLPSYHPCSRRGVRG